MRKFEGIYLPATVADVCLVILPACYRAMLPCRTNSRSKRMKKGGSSDDDETADCDVRRLRRGCHTTTTVAMEQECFVASSSSGADVVSRSEGDGQDDDVFAKKE